MMEYVSAKEPAASLCSIVVYCAYLVNAMLESELEVAEEAGMEWESPFECQFVMWMGRPAML